jgi:hypothetical protein
MKANEIHPKKFGGLIPSKSRMCTQFNLCFLSNFPNQCELYNSPKSCSRALMMMMMMMMMILWKNY